MAYFQGFVGAARGGVLLRNPPRFADPMLTHSVPVINYKVALIEYSKK